MRSKWILSSFNICDKEKFICVREKSCEVKSYLNLCYEGPIYIFDCVFY